MILVNPDSHSPNPGSASAIATTRMKMKQVHSEMYSKWLCTASGSARQVACLQYILRLRKMWLLMLYLKDH